MNITIDQRSLNHLHRLWRSRAKVLHEAAALVPDGPLADKIKQAAEAYGQCAEELETPPVKLFLALGYDEQLPTAEQNEIEKLIREASRHRPPTKASHSPSMFDSPPLTRHAQAT